jgi:hypothetical protein
MPLWRPHAEALRRQALACSNRRSARAAAAMRPMKRIGMPGRRGSSPSGSNGRRPAAATATGANIAAVATGPTTASARKNAAAAASPPKRSAAGATPAFRGRHHRASTRGGGTATATASPTAGHASAQVASAPATRAGRHGSLRPLPIARAAHAPRSKSPERVPSRNWAANAWSASGASARHALRSSRTPSGSCAKHPLPGKASSGRPHASPASCRSCGRRPSL